MWSIGERNGMTLKDELPRSAGAQHAMGDQWRNNSRKNEEIEPKQINPEYSLEGLMLKLKLQYFGHLV